MHKIMVFDDYMNYNIDINDYNEYVIQRNKVQNIYMVTIEINNGYSL